MKRRPATWRQARQQTKIHMHYLISGCSRKRKKQLMQEYANIIEAIWRRWQVGICSLQAKHIRWYLEVKIADRSAGTQYRHWSRCREIMMTLDVFEHWEIFLRGPWRNPDGRPYSSNKSNAGRKPKYCVSR